MLRRTRRIAVGLALVAVCSGVGVVFSLGRPWYSLEEICLKTGRLRDRTVCVGFTVESVEHETLLTAILRGVRGDSRERQWVPVARSLSPFGGQMVPTTERELLLWEVRSQMERRLAAEAQRAKGIDLARVALRGGWEDAIDMKAAFGRHVALWDMGELEMLRLYLAGDG